MTPLLPMAHPHAVANPAVQVCEVIELASQAKVTYPTSHVTVEVDQTTRHRDPTAAAGVVFDALLEGIQFLRRDFDRHTLAYKSEPQVVDSDQKLDHVAGLAG